MFFIYIVYTVYGAYAYNPLAQSLLKEEKK
jgi:hypothetical protein